MRKIFILFLFLSFNLSAQIKSPEDYFGYAYGMKFHFHHQIVEYARYIAQSNPVNSQLISLGRTYEGREQVVVAFGSPENIKNLENIRQKHLQNLSMIEGNQNNAVPAIAMLSFNVHGNESSNAETSLQVLYTLGKADSEMVKKAFENTIIFIDPCENPDGFDRYSQWYNRMVGKYPNANTDAAEHQEPWPGGRPNHYFFDLNRDWAWQTQIESQNRLKFFNSWLPNFHGDFHEMGADGNNFFAPSARPFHEDISGHQREFQNVLGEYHKKNFDQQGWLYFTKNSFDLLYPSYGDTYPTYNGAIGMTYEQAGSGGAGLAYARSDGDTLTLANRIDHVFSTALAAIEAVSDHAEKIKAEQIKYFNTPIKEGYGKYKSFVLKGKPASLKALTHQLEKVGIQYTFADKESNLKGFSYKSQKDESFKVEKEDLIVNTFQPKGVLTKILFEPSTMLEDSSTYDIDSWSMAYAYNLDAYGIGTKLEGSSKSPFNTSTPPRRVDNLYAYVMGIESFEDYQFMAAAMQAGLKVRQQREGFKVNGKNYPAGSLVITRQGDNQFETKINQLLKRYPVALEPIQSGMVESGSDIGRIQFLGVPVIGIMTGQGVSSTSLGDVWHFFDRQLDYPSTLLDNNTLGRVNLSKYDVLIFPSGRYSINSNLSKDLQNWVQAGGRLILMEGAIASFANQEGFEIKTEQQKDGQPDLFKPFGTSGRDRISNSIPGAIFEVKLDNTHPLAYGYETSMNLLIHGKNNYKLLENGWNVGVLGSHKAGFVGSKLKGTMDNMPVFGVQDKGRGKVIYMTNSPIFRSFWYGGKALFANAVFFVK